MNQNNKLFSTLLMGGLGNQIFQICMTKEIEKLGHTSYIDTSNFEKFRNVDLYPVQNREIIFPLSHFSLKETPLHFNLLFNFNKFIFPNRFNRSLIINDANFNPEKFKKFNKLIGYWQNSDLIENNKNFLISGLSKNEFLNLQFKKIPKNGSTALHVRRGDYVNINEELKDAFFIDALKYCEENIAGFNFDVYSDDYEWVKDNKIFQNANSIFNSDISVEGTIKAFGNMLSHENFIVGNSTFSLIAAILMEKKESKIIVADPWFRNQEKELNIKKNWIKIKNIS